VPEVGLASNPSISSATAKEMLGVEPFHYLYITFEANVSFVVLATLNASRSIRLAISNGKLERSYYHTKTTYPCSAHSRIAGGKCLPLGGLFPSIASPLFAVWDE
jgi:hypothetical protein